MNRKEMLAKLSGKVKINESALKNWEAGEDKLKATPSCLTESELRNLSILSEERMNHVHHCEFCTDVFETLIPSDEEVRDFVNLLQEAQESRELVP